MTHRWRLSALVFGVGLTLLATSALTSVLQARATVTTIARGLVNPRGLNFGPDGALYVAEAGSGGSGPCIDGSDGLHKCYGATGGVRKIFLGSPSTTFPRILDQLPSIAPVGMGGNLATGPHDVDFQGLGNGYVTIGLGADPDKRQDPSFAQVGSKFGRLIRFQPNGKWSLQEDLSTFETLANPDGNTPPDSNPYGLLAGPGRTIFTDAGGNSLNAIAANGSISNLAVFPNRQGVPGAPPSGMQAVPTTVATGPDGALYVGQLTGGPFPGGGARVYRVPSNGGTPTIYNENFPGFTKIIDIAFGKDGSLYVLEISAAAGGPPFKSPGALFRIPPGGGTPVDVTPTVAGGFVAPGGIAIGSDGALYITLNSISATDGSVIKVGQ